MSFRVLPEYILEDVVEFFLFVTRYAALLAPPVRIYGRILQPLTGQPGFVRKR